MLEHPCYHHNALHASKTLPDDKQDWTVIESEEGSAEEVSVPLLKFLTGQSSKLSTRAFSRKTKLVAVPTRPGVFPPYHVIAGEAYEPLA